MKNVASRRHQPEAISFFAELTIPGATTWAVEQMEVDKLTEENSLLREKMQEHERLICSLRQQLQEAGIPERPLPPVPIQPSPPEDEPPAPPAEPEPEDQPVTLSSPPKPDRFTGDLVFRAYPSLMR